MLWCLFKLGVKKNFATENWMHSLLCASVKQFRLWHVRCPLHLHFKNKIMIKLSAVARWKSINALRWSWGKMTTTWIEVELHASGERNDEARWVWFPALVFAARDKPRSAPLGEFVSLFLRCYWKFCSIQKKCGLMKMNIKFLQCFSAPDLKKNPVHGILRTEMWNVSE